MKNLTSWKFLLLGLFGCLFTLSSCSSDDDENKDDPSVVNPGGDKDDDEPSGPTEVEIQNGEVTISGTGGTSYVFYDMADIEATAILEATAEDDWVHYLTPSVTEDGRGRIDFTADANPSTTETRETKVTLKADGTEIFNFTVKQAPAPQTGEIEVDGLGGLAYVTYDKTNVAEGAELVATATDEWAHDFVTSVAEDGKGRVEFTVDPNPSTTDARETKVTLKADGIEVLICTVKQAAIPATAAATFTLNIAEVTHNSATVSVTPSDKEVTYYVNILPSSQVDLNDEKALTDGLIPAQDFAMHLKSGDFTDTAVDLNEQTMYTVVVFEYTKNTAGKVYSVQFMTSSAPVTGDKFEITNVTPDYTSVSLHVKPNTSNPWYYVVMSKEYYDKYMEVGGTQELMTRCYYVLQGAAVDRQMDLSDYLKAVAYTGERNLTVDKAFTTQNLKQDAEYAIMVFYVNVEEDDPEQVYDSDCIIAEFKTKAGTGAATIDEISGEVTVKNGLYYVNVTVKGSDIASGRFSLVDRSSEPYSTWDLNDPQSAYTIATLYGKALSAAQCEAIMSAEGYTFTYGPWSYEDTYSVYAFGIWVQNAQGKDVSKAIEIVRP